MNKLQGKPITRRRMIEAMGVAGITGLAGCSGGSDDPATNSTDTTSQDTEEETSTNDSQDQDTEEETSTNDSQEILDKDWVFPADLDTQNVDWNPYSSVFGPIFAGEMYVSQLAGYNRSSSEWEPHAAKNWEITDDMMTIELDERYVWQDGDPITAEDLITNWRIGRHVDGGGVWGYADSIDELDTYELQINLSGEANPQVMLPNILGTKPYTKTEIYGEYLEALDDAQGSMDIEEARETDEHQEAIAELDNFNWRANDDSTPDVVLSGPYQVVEQGQQRIVMELNEEHPAAITQDGQLNFRRAIVQRTSSDTEAAGWADDQFDGRETGAPPERQLPADVHDKIIRNPVPQSQGGGTWLNHDEKWLNERKVRQALAHVIDREQLVENMKSDNPSYRHIAPEYLTFLVGYTDGDPNELWLGDDKSKYKKYEPSHEEAAALLEEVGFSKQGGEWVDPDGEVWEPVVGNPGGGVRETTVHSQMEQFGIQAELRQMDPTSYENAKENGEIDLGRRWWGWGEGSYPYFTLYTIYEEWELAPHRHLTDGREIEIPYPIGDMDGDLQTVDPISLVQELASVSGSERQTEIIKELCWIANAHMPMIPTYERVLTEALVGEPEWQLPADDDDVWNLDTFASRWVFKKGAISAMDS